MDKFAQDRGILNKLREGINLSGLALEKINPEFEAVMDNLRATDARVRDNATDLKAFVRNAASLYRRRDYLAAAKNIAGFHERCRYIAAFLNKFSASIDMKHYKFLLDQFDDEQKQQLFGYDPSVEINVDEDESPVVNAEMSSALKKVAGVVDWYHKMTDPIADLAHNLTAERGKAMRMFEKRFSVGFLRELKSSTERIVQAAIRFLSFLLSNFKRLATALATRNVGQYKKNADNFVKGFSSFDKLFKDYHNKNIVPLKQHHDEAVRQAEEAVKLEEAKQYAAKQNPSPDTSQQPVHVPTQQPVPTHQEQANTLNKLEEDNEPFSITNQMKKSHQDFINRMEILVANDDPKLLINEILKYSAHIEDKNLTDSLKLIAIAEGDWDAWEKKQEVPKTAPKATKPRAKKPEQKPEIKVEQPPLQ